MATLTGKTIANTYKDLLQVSNSNSGVDATLRNVQDGEGTNSALQISSDTVNINGTFQLGGATLTASVSALNNIADLTGATGLVAVSGGTVYGRSIAVGSPLSVTNADGTEGNPTINLANSGVSAGSYGPMNTMTIDAYGRVTDVTATTTISANAFIGGTLSGSSLYVENNVSVSGTLDVAGAVSITGNTQIDGNVSVGGNIVVDGTFTVSGTTSVTGKLFSQNLATSIVSATYLYGDGSNITGLAGTGTMNEIRSGTGIFLTENGTTVTDFDVSGTIGIKPNQSFEVVSITTLDIINKLTVDGSATFPDDAVLKFGDSDDLTIQHNGLHSVIKESGTGDLYIQSNRIRLANTGAADMLTLADGQDAEFPFGVQVSGTVSATGFVGPTITSISNRITSVTDYATSITAVVSSTMATSIDNSNTNITTNTNAITSINSVIAGVSSTLATSINNTNTNLTALSATMATSIDNSNTNIAAVSALTSVNTAAITSVNSKIASVSSTLATSINNTNTNLTALSATMATSIDNSNTNITTNTNAITSINSVIVGVSAALATSIDNSNTNITANTNAITSINSNITTVSAALATSIDNTNTNLTALSATVATSINNTNTNLTALSATLATSITNSTNSSLAFAIALG